MVPVQESDFIFSVASEQLGFLGAMAILILIVLLLLRTMNAARKSCDDLGTYMCFGFFAMIAFQSVINLGMCLSLLPVMGVTLPFSVPGAPPLPVCISVLVLYKMYICIKVKKTEFI